MPRIQEGIVRLNCRKTFDSSRGRRRKPIALCNCCFNGNHFLQTLLFIFGRGNTNNNGFFEGRYETVGSFYMVGSFLLVN